MSFKETKLGLFYEDSSLICLFGNKNSNIETLRKEFPSLQFSRVKQTHSDVIVETSPSEDQIHTADAHFSSNANHALCVNTADCIPILIHDENSSTIAAIHAGWRGVENRIVPKTLQQLKSMKVDLKKINIFIGPHICFESFEVESTVKDQLLASAKNPSYQVFKKLSDDKFKVNLFAILELQLKEFEIFEHQFHLAIRDTLIELDFHSYRRDKEKSGRQISFIAMK